MKARPWPIIVLTILYLLGPVFSILVASYLMHMSPIKYLFLWLPRASYWSALSTFCLYPIAGVAIYLMKPWSYALFITITALTTYQDYAAWRAHPAVMGFPVLFGLTLINVAIVAYFALPSVRTPFFNRRLRWWESKPRYRMEIPAVLESDRGQTKCSLMNLSLGGGFIKSAKTLDTTAKSKLRFAIFNQTILVEARPVYRRARGTRGYGLEFVHTPESKQTIGRIMQGLALAGVKQSEQQNVWASFKDWVTALFRTGRGLVPEMPVYPVQNAKKTASLKTIEKNEV
ncbi:MAG TPA: PilZ domain-containing protein [Bdellovibrionota bacterium]|nr:PilZ domain-containing protein [Bdellovibrionota bacterium]